MGRKKAKGRGRDKEEEKVTGMGGVCAQLAGSPQGFWYRMPPAETWSSKWG